MNFGNLVAGSYHAMPPLHETLKIMCNLEFILVIRIYSIQIYSINLLVILVVLQ